MVDRVNLLIQLLFDEGSSITERDEAAIQLGDFSDLRVIDSLMLKGRQLDENELILNSCGESLGAIWVRQNAFDKDKYFILPSTTRYGIYIVIKSRKPEWVSQYGLSNDKFID